MPPTLSERFDKAFPWAKRIGSVLKLLGIDGWLKASLLAGFAVAWTWLIKYISIIPFWAACLIGLGTALLVSMLATSLWKMTLLRGVKRLDLTQLGHDCVKLREDIFEFLLTRQDTSPKRSSTPLPRMTEDTMHDEWQRGVNYRDQTSAKVAEKFAHRVIALSFLLETAGIAPPHLAHFTHDAGPIAAHIGAIGELLQRGLLAEARALKPDGVRFMHITSLM